MDFRDYLRKKVLKKNDRILEFGPLTRSTVTKSTHPGVRFADIRSTEEIKKLYSSNDYLESTGIKVDLESIIGIDHVVKGSYAESFKGIPKFDAVLLSHVIEHMPDIVAFFQDVNSVIKDTGSLVLIYPDARYCFDYYRNGTSFIDAYSVFKQPLTAANRVFDFVFNVVHENNPYYFWGDEGQTKLLPVNDFSQANEAYQNALKDVLPDDTHFWPFSDYQFVKFLYDMDRAGLLNFEISEFYPTQENTQEFMVILKPKKDKIVNVQKYKKFLGLTNPRLKNLVIRKQIKEALDKNQELKAANAAMEQELLSLRNELHAIQSSKKWKLATKAASLKYKIIRNDDNK